MQHTGPTWKIMGWMALPILALYCPLAASYPTLDQTILVFYSGMQQPPNEAADWTAFNSVTTPDTPFLAMGVTNAGLNGFFAFTRAKYVSHMTHFAAPNGLQRLEYCRHVDQHHNLAQVFSVFETKTTAPEESIESGVFSLQLLLIGHSWKIMSVSWHSDVPMRSPMELEAQCAGKDAGYFRPVR